jgi:hypothetical protein
MKRLLILTAAAALLIAAPGYAQKARPAAPKPAAVKPAIRFAEANTVWADIQAQVKDLEQMVQEKRLDEVHPVAFEIRDLVRTLPDKSKILPAANLKKLESQVRIMDRLAEQLDKYADARNHPATVRQQQAVLRALGTIKALYPAGSFAVHTAAPAANSKERDLYLTPGGAYTEADVRANGSQLPAQKFKGVRVSHDLKPNPGDRICPITLTKANPGYTWVIGGKEYQFCCPPCVEEYVTLAKKDPTAIKPPETFVKK